MGNGAQTQQYTVGKYLERLITVKWSPLGQEWSLPTSNALPWIRSLHCYLKSVNRTYKYLSIRVKLSQKPVSRIKVNGATFKRYNGYMPSLYNFTVDGCKFIKNPKSNPVAHYIYRLFKDFSNVNYTCPFNDDPIIEKLPISYVNKQVTSVLPVPSGDYLFSSHWYFYDTKRITINVYLTIF
ncbi:uncharacterized protein LOC116801073 [Drosophila sechellia]|uniref:uncharacterized protein LOC116801073 n=1 Tax=Drosophila sechellia TaxID=7238 RepID=UPI0013DDC7CD|nr:uncharacterized protein LOC116801073 [Drosophila sechellia]